MVAGCEVNARVNVIASITSLPCLLFVNLIVGPYVSLSPMRVCRRPEQVSKLLKSTTSSAYFSEANRGFGALEGAAAADLTLPTPSIKHIEVCVCYHFYHKIFWLGFNFRDVPGPVLNISCLCLLLCNVF